MGCHRGGTSFSRGRARSKGKGIAGPLLEECEKIARGWGCDGICLHTRRGAFGVAKVYTDRGYRRDPKGDLDLLA